MLESLLNEYGYPVLLLGDIKHYELEVLAFVIAVGVLVWAVFLSRRRKTRLCIAQNHFLRLK